MFEGVYWKLVKGSHGGIKDIVNDFLTIPLMRNRIRCHRCKRTMSLYNDVTRVDECYFACITCNVHKALSAFIWTGNVRIRLIDILDYMVCRLKNNSVTDISRMLEMDYVTLVRVDKALMKRFDDIKSTAVFYLKTIYNSHFEIEGTYRTDKTDKLYALYSHCVTIDKFDDLCNAVPHDILFEIIMIALHKDPKE